MFGFRKELLSILARLEATQSAMVQPAPEPQDRDDVAHLTERQRQLGEDVESLEHQFKDVLQAVAEGIERTERAERRIQQTIKRARKELKERGLEDPGLEAEDRQLRSGDGEGSDPSGLRRVPTPVVPAAEQASSIKGVSVETLQRARGF